MSLHGHALIDLSPDLADLRDTVLAGLRRRPRRLPPWLFYDAAGSALFERICQQPEYYPTRTELRILHDHGAEIADTLGAGLTLVELGSGAHHKAERLLAALRDPDGYIAIDISRAALRDALKSLRQRFPELPVTGIVSDYGARAELPLREAAGNGPLVGFFPGSTIGNMEPEAAERFLAGWAPRLAGGGMLIGVDLVKDPAILDAAYNDGAGMTAAFNRNMLVRIARELDTDLDPDAFVHRAFYNAEASRVEMHLVARTGHRFTLEGEAFAFAAGDGLCSEYSYKYSIEGFVALAERAGFRSARVWTDPKQWFSVHYLTAPAVLEP
ncbi:MAG TPA: L-histidine N(alpha)-methyltransferase [Xanthomonadales bacterium]|nr:L-histidine N(alpha)-methyltransferase [Xanthomonadales bacterium]